jgi:hypothetical protein
MKKLRPERRVNAHAIRAPQVGQPFAINCFTSPWIVSS